MLNLQEIKKLRKSSYTYQQIGDRLGVSRQRVHAVYNNTKYKPRNLCEICGDTSKTLEKVFRKDEKRIVMVDMGCKYWLEEKGII